MNTLNEQQLDYLNYMLGSITSSGSMTHIHTHARTQASTESRTHAVSQCMHIIHFRQTHDSWPYEVRDVSFRAHACVTLVHEPLSNHHRATVWLLCDANRAHQKCTTAAGLSEVTPD